jgi:uncharacterized repeat protein (TIGR03803 family)
VLGNGTNTLSVSAGATSFTLPTPVAYGSLYSVSAQSTPPGLTCSVSSGTGTIPATAVTTVAVVCSVNTYTVGGSISGLATNGLILLNNGADATPINANAVTFTMNTGVAYGAAYGITVGTQPPGLFCSVTDGTGNVGAANVASVTIACAVPTPTTAVLYSFGGLDGAVPLAGLILDGAGNLYGTTTTGGASSNGAVFQLAPKGSGGYTESVLDSFGNMPDGATPIAGLILDSAGNLYGTTYGGGASGNGTVFKVTLQ